VTQKIDTPLGAWQDLGNNDDYLYSAHDARAQCCNAGMSGDTSAKNDGEKVPAARFSVDTHLFRELGELLVGRESTALIELVKNAYDADASKVTVYGENLSDPTRGCIKITDDGNGMDPRTFERGFLRIAARIKNIGDRKSARWGRRFTGAKGIGRLAAHKLARKIEINSVPRREDDDDPPRLAVDGFVDWDEVEKVETLDKISSGAVSATPRQPRKNEAPGTVLTLTRLRGKWTKSQLGRFLLEVEALRAPTILSQPIPASVIEEEPLFDTPTVVDVKSEDPGFVVRLEGEFEIGENYWPIVLDAAHWILEISVSPKRIRYAVTPTKRARKEFGDVKQRRFSEPHPDPENGPFFHSRILIRQGQATGSKDERAWSSRVAGVRVYMEGFRVLPYGEETDDWLSLARDTNERTRKLRFLVDSSAAEKIDEITDEGLSLLPNKHYFGAVFLTTDRAPTLQMLVNREGFIPNHSFETLATIVRRGIDLSTRIRAAAAEQKALANQAEREQELFGSSPKDKTPTIRARADTSLRVLAAKVTQLQQLAQDAPAPIAKKMLAAAAEIGRATEVTREAIPANSMVLVLASVGTQLAAFTHEVNRLLSLAGDLEESIIRLRDTESPSKIKSQVSKVLAASGDLRRALERQAAYLVDILTPDARRRRSRQRISEVLDATWRLVAGPAERIGVTLTNQIDPAHRSPPMFRAELMAVFTNLLTNAVKAAGEDGNVRASSSVADDGVVTLRLENSGVAVDLDDAERWFRPFESTTVDVDPVLGQGMGLGLGITRDLLGEIGATISFVRPKKGFSTAIEIVFPGGG
jgi:signal transduction histidine kinase